MSFAKIAIENATIYTNEGTVVYDSNDPNGEDIGKNTSEWVKDKKDLDFIMSSFQQSERFDLVTKLLFPDRGWSK